MPDTLIATTNPGIEDVAGEEIAALARHHGLTVTKIHSAPDKHQGVVEVTVDGDLQPLRQDLAALRTVHHLRRLLGRFELESLEALAAWFTDLRCPELTEAKSFRITGKRRGKHDFGTHDLQRVTGAAVFEASGVAVDLHDYDLDLVAQVHDQQVDVSVQYTRKALSHRGSRPFNPQTALRANVAWALLALTESGTPETVLDCCVGSGTVLAEAAVRYPEARLIGIDRSEIAVAGTQRNLAERGLEARSEVIQGDARGLAQLLSPESVDLIVTNPPFGVRLGANLNFGDWYRQLLLGAAGVLKRGGRLGILVRERMAFTQALEKVGGMRLIHVRVIHTGTLWPAFYVIERA